MYRWIEACEHVYKEVTIRACHRGEGFAENVNVRNDVKKQEGDGKDTIVKIT